MNKRKWEPPIWLQTRSTLKFSAFRVNSCAENIAGNRLTNNATSVMRRDFGRCVNEAVVDLCDGNWTPWDHSRVLCVLENAMGTMELFQQVSAMTMHRHWVYGMVLNDDARLVMDMLRVSFTDFCKHVLRDSYKMYVYNWVVDNQIPVTDVELGELSSGMEEIKLHSTAFTGQVSSSNIVVRKLRAGGQRRKNVLTPCSLSSLAPELRNDGRAGTVYGGKLTLEHRVGALAREVAELERMPMDRRVSGRMASLLESLLAMRINLGDLEARVKRMIQEANMNNTVKELSHEQQQTS